MTDCRIMDYSFFKDLLHAPRPFKSYLKTNNRYLVFCWTFFQWLGRVLNFTNRIWKCVCKHLTRSTKFENFSKKEGRQKRRGILKGKEIFQKGNCFLKGGSHEKGIPLKGLVVIYRCGRCIDSSLAPFYKRGSLQ